MAKVNWNDENTQRLESMVDSSETVTQERLSEIADEMGTTPRSIGAKLRKLGYEVERAGAKPSLWTEQEEADLRSFVENNPGTYTYRELAAQFMDGKFTDKQIQGKILNLELFDKIRKAEKRSAPRTYTPEEESRFVEMVNGGSTMEQLSEEFGKSVASVRGKALSLYRAGEISAMPTQEVTAASKTADPIAELTNLEEMTVEEIAEATGKSERGIKSILSRRGLTSANYDGAARREKLDSKKEAE